MSFCSYVQTQFCLPILAFQTDNGRELDNFALRQYFQERGISLRLSCPYTSAQNGKAERTLCTLNDSVRTMLLHASAPPSFWVEALNTATYLVNRHPCRPTGAVTPQELLFGTPADYGHLRVFGSLCYPNQAATAPHKLCPRSVPCVFLGYLADHKGYRCYDMATRRVIVSRHVVFDESQFPFRAMHPPSTPSFVVIHDAGDDDIMQLDQGHPRTLSPRPHFSSRSTSVAADSSVNHGAPSDAVATPQYPSSAPHFDATLPSSPTQTVPGAASPGPAPRPARRRLHQHRSQLRQPRCHRPPLLRQLHSLRLLAIRW
jgi:hypothetical protein